MKLDEFSHSLEAGEETAGRTAGERMGGAGREPGRQQGGVRPGGRQRGPKRAGQRHEPGGRQWRGPEPGTTPGVEQIKTYVRDHVDERLDLEDIARQFYISSHYLSHYFRRETGFTLGQFIAQAKIDRAKELLQGIFHVTDTAISFTTATAILSTPSSA